MAILNLVTAPDPILKQKSLAVQSVDDDIRSLMNDMLATMYNDKGIGLAAVQVGELKRVLVADLQDSDDMEREKKFFPLFIANPEITEKSTELVLANEGCLSLPEQIIEVARSSTIKIRFLNYQNNLQEMVIDGWLARVIQHEIDHLDGKLLIDYLSTIKKDIALRKLKKLKQRCLL